MPSRAWDRSQTISSIGLGRASECVDFTILGLASKGPRHSNSSQEHFQADLGQSGRAFARRRAAAQGPQPASGREKCKERGLPARDRKLGTNAGPLPPQSRSHKEPHPAQPAFWPSPDAGERPGQTLLWPGQQLRGEAVPFPTQNNLAQLHPGRQHAHTLAPPPAGPPASLVEITQQATQFRFIFLAQLFLVREHLIHLLASLCQLSAIFEDQRQIEGVQMISGIDLISGLQERNGFAISSRVEVNLTEPVICFKAPRTLKQSRAQRTLRRRCFGTNRSRLWGRGWDFPGFTSLKV